MTISRRCFAGEGNEIHENEQRTCGAGSACRNRCFCLLDEQICDVRCCRRRHSASSLRGGGKRVRACSVDRHGNASSSCRLFRSWRKEYLFPTTYKSYQNITTLGGYKWKILLPLNNISGSAASAVKWNMGRVTPLFKKEDKVYEKNYRPVTVLPIFNIYERVLSDQLWVYSNISYCLTSFQHIARIIAVRTHCYV